jgi:hypothetical protein
MAVGYRGPRSLQRTVGAPLADVGHGGSVANRRGARRLVIRSTKNLNGRIILQMHSCQCLSLHPSVPHVPCREGIFFVSDRENAISLEWLLRFLIRLHQVVGKNVLNKMRSMKIIFGEFFSSM